MSNLFAVAAACLCTLGAILMLWSNWRAASVGPPRHVAAIALLVGAALLWTSHFGVEIGIPLLLETTALLAFAFILTRVERRAERPVRARIAPAIVGGRWQIGVARVLVAGPVGFFAAMGIALLIATLGPGAEQTRLIVAGLIVPSLWAASIAWVVCDWRLPFQAGSLVAVGGLGTGISMLMGS